jgi:hypothetical protein
MKAEQQTKLEEYRLSRLFFYVRRGILKPLVGGYEMWMSSSGAWKIILGILFLTVVGLLGLWERTVCLIRMLRAAVMRPIAQQRQHPVCRARELK